MMDEFYMSPDTIEEEAASLRQSTADAVLPFGTSTQEGTNNDELIARAKDRAVCGVYCTLQTQRNNERV
jgi:hypothetical protein